MELLQSGEFRLKEEDLLRNFTILKFTDPKDDPLKILFPFLEIVKAGHLTGSITLAAIEGIDKLLEMEIINLRHENITEATNDLIASLTRCKFEATDALNDELVLYSILKLLRKISKKLSTELTDSNMCEMIEVALGMYFQSRISEFLRAGALETLVSLARQIFQSLSIRKSFGYKSVVELLRVIASLLDPNNKSHIDSVHRNVGLVLLSVALETGGKELSDFISWALSKVQVKHERFTRKKSLIGLHVVESNQNVQVSIGDSSLPHHLVGLRKDLEIEKDSVQDSVENDDPEELVKIGIMAKELIANDICKSTFQVFFLK